MSQKNCIPVRLRLAKYLHPSGDQCWEWTGAKNEHGYGVKGRGSKPPVRRGTANNKAKLDENKIRLIFQLRHTGLTTYQLADLFCVSRVAICCVLNRTTWRHVDVTNHFC